MRRVNTIVAFVLDQASPGRYLVCGSGAPVLAAQLRKLAGCQVLGVFPELPPDPSAWAPDCLLLVDEQREDALAEAAAGRVDPDRILRAYSHPLLETWAADRARRLLEGDDQTLARAHPAGITRCTLELSDRCNLRCIYCHHNFPRERFTPGRDLSPEQFAEAVAFLTENRIPQVALTGGGETTVYGDWETRLETLLASGTAAAMTTNLSKRFTGAELEALLKFSSLDVSLDCFDAEVIAKVRKGASLSQIVFNLVRLRTEMLKRGLATPTLSLSAVVYAEMVPGFAGLADFALWMGIRTLHLQDFVNYGHAETNVTSLWSLSGAEARDCFARLRAALDGARDRGLDLKIGSGLGSRLEAMNAFLDRGGQDPGPALGPNPEGWADGGRAWSADPVAPLTRDCTDPWDTLQVFGDGTFRTCCFHAMQAGPFDAAHSLAGLWNGDVVVDLRRRLLTGDLDDSCRHCNMRGLTTPEAFRRRIVDKHYS